jgi:O-methyltransferase domain
MSQKWLGGLMADPATCQAEVLVRDFIREPVPGGHEVVLLAQVLHGYPRAENVELLRPLGEAVPEGARVLLVDNWTGLGAHTTSAAEFLVFLGQGDAYSESELHTRFRGQVEDTGPILLSPPQTVVVTEAS